MRVHLHLPKTAGTSLNKYLRNHYKVYGYGKVHKLTVGEINRIINGKYDILVGHISVNEINRIGVSLSNVFTIIRNPIDRCISWYFYTNGGKNSLGMRVPIGDFFRNNNNLILQNCYNRQTYQLGNYTQLKLRDKDEVKVLQDAKDNVDKFYHVFLFENLNSETGEIFNFKLPKKNKTRKYPKKDKISVEVIDLIKRWNRLDIELYNYIVKKKGEGYEKYLIT